VSSLALMRLLETAPRRYDAGMRAITLGTVTRLHEALAQAAVAAPGARVLEVGCGTGAVTERLIARGARVVALDQNPEMLAQATARLAGRAEAVTWLERTAAEIDTLAEASFDAAVASLSFSEMAAFERAFVLQALRRVLKPGGILAVGDEVLPPRRWQRALFDVVRGPQAAVGWLIAGSVSRPIRDLAAEIAAAGFVIRRELRWLLGSLAVVVAERPR
jgi:ubiquinone/menaquinone biosynthesis C-methylase UbiE